MEMGVFLERLRPWKFGGLALARPDLGAGGRGQLGQVGDMVLVGVGMRKMKFTCSFSARARSIMASALAPVSKAAAARERGSQTR